jgi:exodeoxyribonuclease VII small subunit
MTKKTESQPISFEDGYDRMKQISAKLESDDLTVSEMCQSYAEGKALGKALLAYLDEREGELKEIDEGKNLPAFEIVANANETTASGRVAEDEIPF